MDISFFKLLPVFLLVTKAFPLDSQEAKKLLESAPGEEIIHTKTLSLREALEQGLRMNTMERVRKIEHNILAIDLKNQYDKLWYPQVSFKLSTSDQYLKRFSTKDTLSRTSRFPQGYTGIVIEDYSLFNWGKDLLAYQGKRKVLKRAQTQLKEKKRELRLAIFKAYFQAGMAVKKEEIHRKFLRHTSFIYRLARERVGGKRVTRAEYLQARSFFLLAKEAYRKARIETRVTQKDLSKLINDKEVNFYRVSDKLLFRSLRMDAGRAVKMALATSPRILEAQTSLAVSKLDYKKKLREQLPLPEVKLNLGSYLHSYNPSGNGQTRHTTDPDGPGGKNIELRAQMDFSWRLWGQDGILNERKIRRSELIHQRNKGILEGERIQVKNTIYALVAEIKELEESIKILETYVKNTNDEFDLILDQYQRSKMSFLDTKDALKEMKNSEVLYEQTLLAHLEKKLALVETIGIEDFPGENFEHLAQKKASYE